MRIEDFIRKIFKNYMSKRELNGIIEHQKMMLDAKNSESMQMREKLLKLETYEVKKICSSMVLNRERTEDEIMDATGICTSNIISNISQYINWEVTGYSDDSIGDDRLTGRLYVAVRKDG